MNAEHPPAPLVLTLRLPPAEEEASCPGPSPPLQLKLSADERTRLRGLRHSVCGRPLLLQLPRGEALQPGERLAPAAGGAEVVVEAAAEPLLLVRANEADALVRAAYHLGNRHVALEVRSGELRLLDDPVLADLLERLGLDLQRRQLPFLPEGGAYSGAAAHAASHGHSHADGHPHTHGHHPAESSR
jgi:urease accessory protein